MKDALTEANFLVKEGSLKVLNYRNNGLGYAVHGTWWTVRTELNVVVSLERP